MTQRIRFRHYSHPQKKEEPLMEDSIKRNWRLYNYCLNCNLEYPKFSIKCAVCNHALRTKSRWRDPLLYE